MLYELKRIGHLQPSIRRRCGDSTVCVCTLEYDVDAPEIVGFLNAGETARGTVKGPFYHRRDPATTLMEIWRRYADGPVRAVPVADIARGIDAKQLVALLNRGYAASRKETARP